VAALAAAALAIGGCSDSSSSADSSKGGTSSSSSSTTSGTTVNITLKGDSLTPNGERLQVKVGEPVTLKIDADRAGELHVHSTPEQHIEFAKGNTTHRLTIKTPGVVDIEDHALEKVIVQLQVS
jgi:hypothetical protein